MLRQLLRARQHVRAAEAEHEEHLHGPPANPDVVEDEFDGPSDRDSARAQLDHQLQAECRSDAPERVEAWRDAACFEAGDGGLCAANSAGEICLGDAETLAGLAHPFCELGPR